MFLFDFLVWWRLDRLLRPLRRAARWRVGLTVFMTTQILVLGWMVFGRIFTRGSDPHMLTPLMAVSFVWHLLILPMTLLAWIVLGAGSLARGASSRRTDLSAGGRAEPISRAGPAARPETVVREGPVDGFRASEAGDSADTGQAIGRGHIVEHPGPVAPDIAAYDPAFSRRSLLRGAAAAAPPLLAVAGAARGLSQLDEFRVRQIRLQIPNLPPALEGLSIAHVSDTHVGDFTNGPTLAAVAEATNRLRADFVLLTGDLINRRLSDLPAALDMVRRMDARHGVFLCEGNHDLFEGPREFRRRVLERGVRLLADDSAVVPVKSHDVQLLGLRWGRGEAAIAEAMPPLLGQLRPGAFPILLAHHPHAFDPAAAAGIPLTLSGHTHGGQFNLAPDFGFGRLMYRYWSGEYAKRDSRLVVSNGVGNWFPLRIGAPAEIVHVTLSAEG